MGNTWEVIRRATAMFMQDSTTLMGAGVAFWAVLSLSPSLVLMVMVASLVFDVESSRSLIVQWLDENVGGRAAESIISLLDSASAPGSFTLPGLFSVALMLWSSSRLFHALQMALNHIWNVKQKERKHLGKLVLHVARKRALTFALLVSLSLLILVSLTIGTTLPVVARWFDDIPGWYYVYRTLELSLSSVIICVGVGLIFKILPDARVPWRFVWRGALLTGVLLILGKLVLSWYLSRQSLGSYGAAGSVVALLLWVYVSTQVFFFGAELTQAYALVAGWPQEPEPYAERKSTEPRSSSVPPIGRASADP